MCLKTRVFITKHSQPLLQAHIQRSAWVSVTTVQRHVGPGPLHRATWTQPNVLLPEGGSGPGREGRDSL